MLDATGHLVDLGTIAHVGKDHAKLVATQAGQHIHGAELVFDALRHLLQVEISYFVAIGIIHLLEVIEVNVEQAEGDCIVARLLDQLVDILLQRKAIMGIGQNVEFRAVDEIGV